MSADPHPPARTPPPSNADRARTMAQIVDATLDRIPGAREALPHLHQLAQALRQRGLVALNEQPLPSRAQIRAVLNQLAPHELESLRDARALMLSRLDRRSARRLPPGSLTGGPGPLTTGLESQEVPLSEFYEVLGVPMPAAASLPTGPTPPPASAPGVVPTPTSTHSAKAATGRGRSASRPAPAEPALDVSEVSLEDFLSVVDRQARR